MKDTISFSWSPISKRYDIEGLEERLGTLTLGSWLSADIQTSLSGIKDWITWINEIAAGTQEGGYIGTGNAFSVMAVGEQVFIECEYVDDQKVFLTRDQVIHVLEQYRDFVKSDIENPNFHPKPIEVEYLAEGEEAAKCYAETGGSSGYQPHQWHD